MLSSLAEKFRTTEVHQPVAQWMLGCPPSIPFTGQGKPPLTAAPFSGELPSAKKLPQLGGDLHPHPH